jgi:uncharacterized protein with HEPN domain
MYGIASAIPPMGRSSFAVADPRRSTGMHDWLIHAYFDIDHDVLGRTAVEEIPALLPLLRTLATDI